MRVLIGCECSGIVRQAFRERGHDAWSCDLDPAEDNSPYHFQEDVRAVATRYHWDMAILHPPCTYLANSGAKHLYIGMSKKNGPNWERIKLVKSAAEFFLDCWKLPIQKKAVENSIMHDWANALIGFRQTQIIQPWQHGHGEIKAICLYLDNLPLIVPSNIVDGREARIHKMGKVKGLDRGKERSRFLPGVAKAFAAQWG